MHLNSARALNFFLVLKLPAAFICGIRVRDFSTTSCTVTVTHRWINQNPFRSLYFAVQAMAAELTTGALVMRYIQESSQNISMLVTENRAVFTKKATGKITFVCTEGERIQKSIQNTIQTTQGEVIWLKSIGTDEKNDIVSEMDFCWSIKLKG